MFEVAGHVTRHGVPNVRFDGRRYSKERIQVSVAVAVVVAIVTGVSVVTVVVLVYRMCDLIIRRYPTDCRRRWRRHPKRVN